MAATAWLGVGRRLMVIGDGDGVRALTAAAGSNDTDTAAAAAASAAAAGAGGDTPRAASAVLDTTGAVVAPGGVGAAAVALLGDTSVGGDGRDPVGEHLYANHEDWHLYYPDCGLGQQSPVDIRTDLVQTWGPPDTLLRHMNITALPDRKLKHTGKSIQVDGEFSRLTLPDGVYKMRHFQFHFPSEHTFDGEHLPGELHMVHTLVRPDGTTSVAAVALLLRYLKGVEDVEWFSALKFKEGLLPEKARSSVNVGVVDSNALRNLLNGSYVHYQGSTTTPPCVPGVHWYVLSKTGYISRRQVEAVKRLFPDPQNNRPVQDIDGRTLLSDQLATPGEFQW